MGNYSLNNLLKDPRTNWKFIWIVVIIGFLAGAGILGYYSWWVKQQEAKFTEIPTIKLPEKVTKNGTTGWLTFQDNRYVFRFQHPGTWTIENRTVRVLILKDEENEEIVSIDTGVNLSIIGISYCEAYSQDVRCEALKIDGIPVTVIDWGIDGKANAMFRSPDDTYGVSFTLQKVTPDTKIIFRQILSTFKFIE